MSHLHWKHFLYVTPDPHTFCFTSRRSSVTGLRWLPLLWTHVWRWKAADSWDVPLLPKRGRYVSLNLISLPDGFTLRTGMCPSKTLGARRGTEPRCNLDCPLVAGCSVSHKPHLLHVSRWDTDQTKKVKVHKITFWCQFSGKLGFN